MNVRFNLRPDYRRQIDWNTLELEAKAQALASTARGLTPAAREAATITVADGSSADGVPTKRVGSGDSFFHLFEWGSINNPAYRPLTRAAEALGFDFRPTAKGG